MLIHKKFTILPPCPFFPCQGEVVIPFLYLANFCASEPVWSNPALERTYPQRGGSFPSGRPPCPGGDSRPSGGVLPIAVAAVLAAAWCLVSSACAFLLPCSCLLNAAFLCSLWKDPSEGCVPCRRPWFALLSGDALGCWPAAGELAVPRCYPLCRRTARKGPSLLPFCPLSAVLSLDSVGCLPLLKASRLAACCAGCHSLSSAWCWQGLACVSPPCPCCRMRPPGKACRGGCVPCLEAWPVSLPCALAYAGTHPRAQEKIFLFFEICFANCKKIKKFLPR